MKITFMGTGTSAGVPELGCNCEVCRSEDNKDKRTRTSLLIRDNNRNIIIDCGPDFRQQALREGISTIDSIILTHSHFDHIAGLEELRPVTKESGMPVWCESFVAEQIRIRLHYCFGNIRKGYAADLDLKIFDPSASFEVCGCTFTPIRLIHHKLPVCGFRFGKIAYLTDFTEMDDQEMEKLQGVEILIIEALRQTPHVAHISLSQALDYIRMINPVKSYLIHMNHQFGLHEEVQKQLPDNVIIAHDGLSFDVV